MRRYEANHILEEVGKHLQLNLDYLIVREKIDSIFTFDIEKKEIFIHRLNEAGRDGNLIFLEHNVPADEFREVLEQPITPMLVFSAGEKFLPYLLTDHPNGSFKGIAFKGKSKDPVTFNSKEDLIKELTEDNGSISFYLPLVIDPLASGSVEASEALPPVKRLARLLKTERRDISHIYFYAILGGLVSLTLPLGIQAIVSQVSTGMIMEPAILLITFVILGTLATGGLQILQATVVEKIQQRLFSRAAFEFAFRMPRVRTESILKHYPPELMNRFFDILTIQKGFSKLLNEFLTSALQILFGLTLLSFYHPFFVFFGLCLLVFLGLIFWFSGPRGLRTSLEESKYKYRVAHWLQEVARSVTTFKLSGSSNFSLEKTDRYLNSYLRKRKDHFRILITQLSSIVVFKTLVTGGVLILGSILVVNRQISLGQFVASEILIITIIVAVEKIFLSLDTIYDLLTAVEKIGFVTDLPMERNTGVVLQENIKGLSIRLKGLSYTYPESKKDVLKNIDLDIAPGEKICILGCNGSGKTTLIKTVSGLLDSWSGSILMNGIPLQNIDKTSLRDKFGDNLTYQDIFEGSIRENITIGKHNISYREVSEALRQVGLQDWVASLPDGMETELTAGGGSLPSSTLKKLSLARSLVGNRQLMFFDDFFYNMEPKDKRMLIPLIFSEQNPATVLCISHDPVLLKESDRIAIMRGGRLIELGTYEELKEKPAFLNLVTFVTA